MKKQFPSVFSNAWKTDRKTGTLEPDTCLPFVIQVFPLCFGASRTAPAACPTQPEARAGSGAASSTLQSQALTVEVFLRIVVHSTPVNMRDEDKILMTSTGSYTVIWCKYLWSAPHSQTGKNTWQEQCRTSRRQAHREMTWAPLCVAVSITSPITWMFLHGVLK